MKNLFTSLTILFIFSISAFAQKTTPVAPGLVPIKGAKAIEMSAPFFGKANLEANSPNYARAVAIKHGGPDENISDEEITNYLQVNKYIFIDDSKKRKVNNTDIVVHEGYRSNQFNGGTPMDNSVAVSNSGIVVSAVNTNFSVFDSTGKLLIGRNFNGIFFGDPSLNSTIFDPRVIYDSEADRFIMCIMHGSQPSNSRLIVLFSESSNPVDGWNIYILPGNPLNNGTWFDYPHIGLTETELFITGNLFRPITGGNAFNQSVIFQINKADGYNNEASLDYQVWEGIQNADNSTAFSLVPVIHGFDKPMGPGMYFIATRSNQGGTTGTNSNYVDLFYISDTKESFNEEISTQRVQISNFLRPERARQSGVSHRLSCGDARMQSSFILDSTIHFAFAERGSFNLSAIRYGRISLRDLSVKENTFGASGESCAFPSIASFTDVETEQGAIICFEASNSEKFPEIRIVGVDNDMNFTQSFLVKDGEASVTIFNSGTQRWGDYTGIARRHNAGEPEVWICAAYGYGVGIWSNFNAKITTSSDKVAPGPEPITTNEPAVYPNPSSNNSQATIALDIPEDAYYTITLYNELGQKVRVLLEDRFTPDHKFLVFSTQEVASGTYTIVIESDKGYYETLKIVILNDN